MRISRFFVVAVCGLKRAGKDTVGDVLVRRYSYDKMKFADPLKQMVKAAFAFTDDQLESETKDRVDDRFGCTPRKILQFFGTELMQFQVPQLFGAGARESIGRSFWARRLVEDAWRRCTQASEGGRNGEVRIVITDMRFRHELTELRRMCADMREVHGVPASMLVIQVRREAQPQPQPQPQQPQPQPQQSGGAHTGVDHLSEEEWKALPADAVVINCGSIEDVEARVTGIMEQMHAACA